MWWSGAHLVDNLSSNELPGHGSYLGSGVSLASDVADKVGPIQSNTCYWNYLENRSVPGKK